LAHQVLQMGAYDFITKPCGIEEIVFKIEAAFERKQIKAKKGSA